MAEQREQAKIVSPMQAHFEAKGWHVFNLHGNAYQAGLPDKFIVHKTGKFASRFVEFKVFDEHLNFSITPAQKIVFPILVLAKAPVWVIADHDLRGETKWERREAHYRTVLTKPSNLSLALTRETRRYLYVSV